MVTFDLITINYSRCWLWWVTVNDVRIFVKVQICQQCIHFGLFDQWKTIYSRLDVTRYSFLY